MPAFTITHNLIKGKLIFWVPYCTEFGVALRRDIPPEDRKWNKDMRRWEIEDEHRATVEMLLNTHFPSARWNWVEV